jgi:hypothetical protein
MAQTAQRVNLFDIIPVSEYHSELIHNWFHLVKDGMVGKNDESMFTEVGKRFVSFIFKNHRIPDYGEILGWIPEMMGEE